MATERQLAANRRNAGRSTGPRSISGKKRVSRNAYSHGLSVSITSIAPYAKCVNDFAQKIARCSRDPVVLERARAIAEAELDLHRVRTAKLGLIQRVHAFGAPGPLPYLNKWREIKQALKAYYQGLDLPDPIDPASTMPKEEPDRTAEAVRRVLPDIRKLDRYEVRAAARLHRAIQAFAQICELE
jgi:hypothetical protein